MIKECAPSPSTLVARNLAWRLLKATSRSARFGRYRPRWQARVDVLANRTDVTSWRFKPDCCGIGFGGPVDFPTQTVTLSTHVGGWAGFPLVERIEGMTRSADGDG